MQAMDEQIYILEGGVVIAGFINELFNVYSNKKNITYSNFKCVSFIRMNVT